MRLGGGRGLALLHVVVETAVREATLIRRNPGVTSVAAVGGILGVGVAPPMRDQGAPLRIEVGEAPKIEEAGLTMRAAVRGTGTGEYMVMIMIMMMMIMIMII